MTKTDVPNKFEIGFAGLDSTGRRMARAVAEQGLRVAVCDARAENVKILLAESAGIPIRIAAGMAEFVGLLRPFRTVVVSESEREGDLFSEVAGQLEAGDLLIDACDCHYKECERRAWRLAERNIRHLEIGIIDGDEDGGCPVLVAGGNPSTYQNALPLMEAMDAKTDSDPHAIHVGPAGAGHFVKMIYEGIEYSLTQSVLEIFDLLKAALDLDEGANQLLTEQASSEVGTARRSVRSRIGEATLPKAALRPLNDNEWRNLTRSWQTGALNPLQGEEAALWTSQASRELNVPTPTIDAVVGMRVLSEWEKQNDFATAQFRQPAEDLAGDRESILAETHGALRVATIITCAQGMAVLAAGSECYGFDLDRAEIAGLWKLCSGNRIAFLDEIASSLQAAPELVNLLYDSDLSEKVMEQQESLRHTLWRARLLQTPAPVLMASLDYLDCDRGAWMPFNLIQSPHLADLVHR